MNPHLPINCSSVSPGLLRCLVARHVGVTKWLVWRLKFKWGRLAQFVTSLSRLHPSTSSIKTDEWWRYSQVQWMTTVSSCLTMLFVLHSSPWLPSCPLNLASFLQTVHQTRQSSHARVGIPRVWPEVFVPRWLPSTGLAHMLNSLSGSGCYAWYSYLELQVRAGCQVGPTGGWAAQHVTVGSPNWGTTPPWMTNQSSVGKTANMSDFETNDTSAFFSSVFEEKPKDAKAYSYDRFSLDIAVVVLHCCSPVVIQLCLPNDSLSVATGPTKPGRRATETLWLVTRCTGRAKVFATARVCLHF